ARAQVRLRGRRRSTRDGQARSRRERLPRALSLRAATDAQTGAQVAHVNNVLTTLSDLWLGQPMRGIAVAMLCACSGSHAMPSTTDGSTLDTVATGDAAGDSAPVERCAGKTSQPADSTWTLMVGSLSRTANVHVPASYDPTRPIPVVIDLHGRLGNAV